MSGQLGNERVTVQSLELVRVDAERGLLLVKGGIPGAPGSDVRPSAVSGQERLKAQAAEEIRMNLNIAAPDAGADKAVQVSETTFGREFNEALVHQVVVTYLAGARARHQSTEDAGGGSRRWPQALAAEGNGAARAGSIRSPIWRGGGRPLRPGRVTTARRSTARCIAVLCVPSSLNWSARIGWLWLSSSQPRRRKPRLMVGQLNALSVDNVLIVTEGMNENLYLASRNLKDVDVRDVQALIPSAFWRTKSADHR